MVQRFGGFKKIAYLCIRIRNNKFNQLKNQNYGKSLFS